MSMPLSVLLFFLCLVNENDSDHWFSQLSLCHKCQSARTLALSLFGEKLARSQRSRYTCSERVPLDRKWACACAGDWRCVWHELNCMAGAQFAMLRERMLAWNVVWCRCCGVAKTLRQKSAIYHEPPREQYESPRTKPILEKLCHLSLLVCVGMCCRLSVSVCVVAGLLLCGGLSSLRCWLCQLYGLHKRHVTSMAGSKNDTCNRT